MTKITESSIEALAIDLLERLGYEYIHAPDIAPDSETPERKSFDKVLLIGRLEKAVHRINPAIPADVIAEAVKEIQRIASPDLLANNEMFHRYLTEVTHDTSVANTTRNGGFTGVVPVSRQVDCYDRGDRGRLIDFDDPCNNDFLAAIRLSARHAGAGHRNRIKTGGTYSK